MCEQYNTVNENEILWNFVNNKVVYEARRQ